MYTYRVTRTLRTEVESMLMCSSVSLPFSALLSSLGIQKVLMEARL